MKNRILFAGFLLFLLGSPGYSDIIIEVPSNSINVLRGYTTKQWADINYVLCKGLGINGTGKVEVTIKVGRMTREVSNIESLSVVTSYPPKDASSASITYTDPSGTDRKIILVRPWFDTIGPPNTQELVLPRVSTDKDRNSQKEGMTFEIKTGTAIVVKTVVMFPEYGFGCIGSSEKNVLIDWPLM